MSDTSNRAPNFHEMEPHKFLPSGQRETLRAACERVLQRPADFAEANTWLETAYSEAEQLTRLIADAQLIYKFSKEELELEGKKNAERRKYAEQLKADFNAACAEARYIAHQMEERLCQAIRDVVEKELQSGDEALIQAARVVFLAAVVFYPYDLPLPGEYCHWSWNETGNLFIDVAQGNGDPTRDTWRAGRMSILFPSYGRHAEQASSAGPLGTVDAVEEYTPLEAFVKLVGVALKALPAAETGAKSAVAVPAGAEPAADDPALIALTPNEQAFIDVLGPAAQTGPDIVSELNRQGYNTFTESTISKMSKRPKLQARGVRHEKKAGYYILPQEQQGKGKATAR